MDKDDLVPIWIPDNENGMINVSKAMLDVHYRTEMEFCRRLFFINETPNNTIPLSKIGKNTLIIPNK